MLEFDGLLKIGEDDVNSLVKLLEAKMKEERLVFHGLEAYVRAWLASYVTLKEGAVKEDFIEVDSPFMIF
jgi:hypothetical protein